MLGNVQELSIVPCIPFSHASCSHDHAVMYHAMMHGAVMHHAIMYPAVLHHAGMHRTVMQCCQKYLWSVEDFKASAATSMMCTNAFAIRQLNAPAFCKAT